MCGVMKSFWSAIIFEQERFGHHRQKEKRHQTHQSRLDRDVHDPRQRREQHQHENPQTRPDSPAKQKLARRTATRSCRSQQCIGAELYCESQSSGDEHCIVLLDGAVVRPKNDCRDDDESGGNPGEETECALLFHFSLFPLPSSLFPLALLAASSCFCAALILRYML